MATTITDTLLGGIRQQIIDLAAYGRYKIGVTWYQAEIETADIRPNGSVRISFLVEPKDEELTPATHFQLCDENGNVLAERTDTISFVPNAADAISYRFKFGVRIGEEAEE